jgi:hypothetical protein
VKQEWDDTYKFMVDHGFSAKPAMEGAGTSAGEAYAWAIEHPEQVSCIYAENPSLRSLMTNAPPLEHLDVLAKAAVPLLHECGSLDPWLNDQTGVAEKRYKELGGSLTVLIREGEGHFLKSSRDLQPVVEFVISHAK